MGCCINYEQLLNNRKLREGYTTGACAAAAAKGAVYMLFNKKKITKVRIYLPAGREAEFDLDDITIGDDSVFCSVKKFAGDDPDVTDGIKIFACVSESGKLEITGGEGVGMVTRPGLSISPGKYAINPVPLEMIRSEAASLLPPGRFVKIEISAPGGRSVAKKTFNSSLGIIGGISILGTTGIVKPMSEEAVKKTFSLKLSQMKAEAVDPVVFCPGNYGVNFVKKYLHLPGFSICMISNYVGYMLEEAASLGLSGVLLAGHIGKLVKIAGRIFNTHSRVADARQEILASYYALFSGDMQGFGKIMNSLTMEEAVGFINSPEFYTYLADTIVSACGKYVRGDIDFACALFSMEHGLLGKSKGCDEMIQRIKEPV